MVRSSGAAGIKHRRVLQRGIVVGTVLVALGATALPGWGCSGTDCGPGTVDRGGVCVAVCAPGTVRGTDGLCHPEGADGDGDEGGDADADFTVEIPVDDDAAADRGGDADADGDADGDADDDIVDEAEGDGALDRCTDAATCADMARAMLELMNADRDAAGCPAFTWDDRLAAAALECATGMAAAGSMTGCPDMPTRLEAHGLTSFADVSEFYVHNPSLAAAELVVATHVEAANYLLKCSFTVAGVGIAPSTDGSSMWFCQTYLTP
jgi:hypothetical protein